jgi:hypothetical protein
MHREQPPHLDGKVRRPLAKADKQQVLADGHLVPGVEDQIVRQGHGGSLENLVNRFTS